jgi:hypothetical protein
VVNPTATPIRFTLHLFVLWSFAVAEPLYEVLARNGEFFVAHRVGPLDLALFMGLVSLVLPAGLALVLALVERLLPFIAPALRFTVIAVLLGAIVSEVLTKSASLAAAPQVLASAVVGAAGAWLYGRQPLAHTFLTVLGPSVLVFPVLAALQPSMAPFVRPRDRSQSAAATLGSTRPPIVVVVFDQLPLTSLMSDANDVDPKMYPGFAALASDATWYRNASTAAEQTGWAIPPILTGLRPRPDALPTSRDYPDNLFTLLGNGYRYEVDEPITHFCPDRLCDNQLAAWPARLASTSLDAGVVLLHVMLPSDLQQSLLPPLTQNWKDFIREDHWLQRWVHRRDDDRRVGPREFIAGIAATDPQPTLYYLHALLPHDPFVYLRSGQRYSDTGDQQGLLISGVWVDEEWPVLLAYRRHLLQLQFVDALVGRLVARLKDERLWDQALVVVTADHGAAFWPGHPFKGLDDDTLADIMAVPLFVKVPAQHGQTVSDRNIESIDIVPTIADVLHVALPWTADGRSALLDAPRSGAKRIQHKSATESVDIDTTELARLRQRAVHRRLTLFGGVDGDFLPEASAHRELIGQEVAVLRPVDIDKTRVQLDHEPRYRDFDPASDALPALMSGSVIDDGHLQDPDLAVAVNGVVRATTRTYNPPGKHLRTWTAFVHPRYFRKGTNDVEVFVIDDRGSQVRLDLAYGAGSSVTIAHAR